MTTDITKLDPAGTIEQVVIQGNLQQLTPGQRVEYYGRVCQSLGINALTRPFDYITLNGKLTLYARKDATDQLRKIHRVNIHIVSRERIDDVYVVTARATLPDGREDEEIGAVNIAGLKGENLANALMKSSTKAKRRVTLSIVGLGMLDETEVETVRDARSIHVDTHTGEVLPPTHEQPQEKDLDEMTVIGTATGIRSYITNDKPRLGFVIDDTRCVVSDTELIEAYGTMTDGAPIKVVGTMHNDSRGRPYLSVLAITPQAGAGIESEYDAIDAEQVPA